MTFVLVVLVLATECTRHRVIRPHHIHTRHRVIRLGCTPRIGTCVLATSSRHSFSSFSSSLFVLVVFRIRPHYVPFFKHENFLVCQEFFTCPRQLQKLSKPDSFDMLPRLSPSPPVPVWDTPVTPSFGFQLLLPPSTTDLSVVTGVEVVSLAIDATASVGVTFGVERIARHIVRRFDMWGLWWVRAAAARRGGVESRTDADSVEILETFGFTQSEFDHNYITITWEIDPSYPLGCESDTYHVIDILTHAYQPNVLQVDSLSVGGANLILKPKEGPTVTWTCPMSFKCLSHSGALTWCEPCIFGKQARLSAPTLMTW